MRPSIPPKKGQASGGAGGIGTPAEAQWAITPEQFVELCQANPEAVLELAADGSRICMTPTGSDTGARNDELFFQINS